MRGALKENNRLNVTLSIDTILFNELKKESNTYGTSVNSQISTILSKHVRFHKIMDEVGQSVISQNAFASMLEIMDEEKLCKIMENQNASSIYPIFTHNGIPLTLENTVRYFFEQFGLWAGMYSACHCYTDSRRIVNLTFEHRYGLKWSKVLGRMFCSMIKNLFGADVHYEILGNTVKIMILEGSNEEFVTKEPLLDRVLS